MMLRDVIYGLTVAIMTVFLVGCEQGATETVPASIEGFSFNS